MVKPKTLECSGVFFVCQKIMHISFMIVIEKTAEVTKKAKERTKKCMR